MEKWIRIKDYGKYVLWLNTKIGCRECFWPEVNPNDEKDLLENSTIPQKHKPGPRPFSYR